MLNEKATKAAQFLVAGLKNLRNGLNELSLEQFIVNTLEVLMHMEREEYLKELKENGGRDKGNGFYERAFKSFSENSLSIRIPRTRYTDFKPFALEFLKYSQEQINNLVLHLYAAGVTTREISKILANFFGEEISYSQVSNLAEKFHEVRLAWENSPLESYYKVVFCDATYITLRRGSSYSKEAVHISYGVREDNKRELLGLSVNPTESASSWADNLKQLKSRKVDKADLIVADGLKGLENEVHRLFPGSDFQKCTLHKKRNILRKIRPKDKAMVAKDLEEIFNNVTEETSFEERKIKVESFIVKWAKMYPYIKRSFAEDTLEYYFTYLKYPPFVRKMIYTTNSIENLNKQIKRATKNKQSFEKEERLLDYIFVVIKRFESENWMKYPVSAFSQWTHNTQ